MSETNTTPNPWNPPETAPRDGTIIIADFGWPFPLLAIWNGNLANWSVAGVEVSIPDADDMADTCFVGDSETDEALIRWTPFPKLPDRGEENK